MRSSAIVATTLAGVVAAGGQDCVAQCTQLVAQAQTCQIPVPPDVSVAINPALWGSSGWWGGGLGGLGGLGGYGGYSGWGGAGWGGWGGPWGGWGLGFPWGGGGGFWKRDSAGQPAAGTAGTATAGVGTGAGTVGTVGTTGVATGALGTLAGGTLNGNGILSGGTLLNGWNVGCMCSASGYNIQQVGGQCAKCVNSIGINNPYINQIAASCGYQVLNKRDDGGSHDGGEAPDVTNTSPDLPTTNPSPAQPPTPPASESTINVQKKWGGDWGNWGGAPVVASPPSGGAPASGGGGSGSNVVYYSDAPRSSSFRGVGGLMAVGVVALVFTCFF